MKKNQIIENIQIQGVASEGKCITRYQDRVIFIAGNKVAPGDVVDLKVIKKRKSYLEAIPIHFHSHSPDKIDAFCQHFGVCGGCKWQHLPYDLQLIFKQQQVKDNLERIAKVAIPEIRPILASASTQYYRNKLEFSFSSRRWLTDAEVQLDSDTHPIDQRSLGFHVPGRFDKILPIEHCYLQRDPSNAIRLATRDYALEHNLSFFDPKEHVGLLRNMVIRTSSAGDVMLIVLFFYEDLKVIEALLSHLQAKFPAITSLQYIINPKKNDSYNDLEPVLFSGKPYIMEEMEGLQFRIGAKSFYQTNSEQAYTLYKVARDFADLKGSEVVYDLYTGTGTIANFVAAQAQQVVGIEYVEEAIADAKINSQINGIEHTSFFAGDMKDLLNPAFVQTHGQPEVIITDPPRAGMHADVVKTLLVVEAPRIVYVSCNPATQARDLALLDEKYRITAIQPVDMFPHTHHVENVVKLEKK